MKKLTLLILLASLTTAGFAQVEHLYNFNTLTTGTQCLNGQDGWSTHYQTAGSSQDFDVDYTSGTLIAPDESIAVFYPYGGPGVGRTATRKASDNFNFNFQNGGIMDLEFDLVPAWWGDYVGVGFDADGDNNILEGMTEGDGGVYLRVAGSGNDNHPNLHLPNGTDIVTTAYRQEGWAHYKLSFDFSAFNGAGSVTVFVKDFTAKGWSDWIQISDLTEINMGLTPGSGNSLDYRVWDGIFFHCQGGTGGFDNILIRQMPDGNVQYINMEDIPNQLTFNAPITLTATATSGLPVSFELLEGPATLSGNILTLTGAAGMVKVKATQAGNSTWLPAPDVIKTFEVVDAAAYTPTVTIRRPYQGTEVYMDQLHPMMLVVSAYIAHPEVIKFTDVKCTVDGQDILLQTYYPDNAENGYFSGTWTPSAFGSYNMTVSVTTSGDHVYTFNNSFEVTNQIDNSLDVVTLNGDLVCTPTQMSVKGEYALPSHVGAFNNIMAHYDHRCVNGHCDTYDRIGGIRIRNYRGEWVELFRYISPFGVECQDDVDVTDYTSLLQGYVEFEYYFETWNGEGFNPILTLTYTKGTPDYLYADVDEIWHDTYSFGDYKNQFPVPQVHYLFSDKAQAAKLKLTTTGHNWSSSLSGGSAYNTGNAAEFYEATHHIRINGQNKYDQHLWRTCNPNPAGCQPQNGTWIYDRSGWCPGSIAMVWDFDLSEYLPAGQADLFYQFDPTYLDLCHPNHPDCIDGQNSCPHCDDPDNPLLRVSGKVVSYSNDDDVFWSVTPLPDFKPAFTAHAFPNPAKDELTITTDYDKGKLCVLLINMQGQIVRNFTVDKSRSIDVSDLPSGVYMLKMLGGTVITQKIMIQ
ncbi:MAG: T9SS type A sorting domain-containing protein [Candidatus Limimorpha sp.]